ncbi:hypothetical protein MSPP1_000589 [Malassezia sp. CBS 17886]|nr:hypothetical protein MSPP1_000589 [Malassezia sp. CBS 17886]
MSRPSTLADLALVAQSVSRLVHDVVVVPRVHTQPVGPWPTRARARQETEPYGSEHFGASGAAGGSAKRGTDGGTVHGEPEYDAAAETANAPLRATRVPSSRLGRLLHYGSLGAGLAWGSAGEYLRRASGGQSEGAPSVFMSEANVNRLVDKLSTMRGAALKLGQFLSIQDSHMLPPQVEHVMLRVQNSAHYMPAWQLEQVLCAELGDDWRTHFASFDERPFAAASIGQVHTAVLADPFPAQPELAGQRVAVKVQFPGVAESIASDLGNIKWLLMASALLPRGLFLDSSVRTLQRELAEECDYTREAAMGRRFREHLDALPRTRADALAFEVPAVVDALSTRRVLTTEFMAGRPLTHASRLDQTQRDRIAHAVMELSLRELFDWRLMQTDPNWTNFLFHERRGAIQLIDFGATREYSRAFIDLWLALLRAAVAGDADACAHWSVQIGYLTGEESAAMRGAHVRSMLTLGEPFRRDAPAPYPFAHQTITDRVREDIPLMIRERLRPPPPETYSLNRKLSGAFLLCARLGASVNCRDLFHEITSAYPTRAREDGVEGGGGAGESEREAVKGEERGEEEEPTEGAVGRNLVDVWAKQARASLEQQTHDAEAAAHDAEAPPPAEPTDLEPDTATLRRPVEPGYVMVRGIPVPRRPMPPGAEDCCMSGCARCVYDLYTEELQDYKAEMADVHEKLKNAYPPLTAEEWDEGALGQRPSAAGASAVASVEADDDVDPSLKAFMALEKKIKAG